MKISSIIFISTLCNQSVFAWGLLRGGFKAGHSSPASDMVVIEEGGEFEEEPHDIAIMEESTILTIKNTIVGGYSDQDHDRELPVVTVPHPTGLFGPVARPVPPFADGGGSPNTGKR